MKGLLVLTLAICACDSGRWKIIHRYDVCLNVEHAETKACRDEAVSACCSAGLAWNCISRRASAAEGGPYQSELCAEVAPRKTP